MLRCADVPPEGFAEGDGGVIQRLMWAAREAVNGMDLLRVMPCFSRVLAANATGRSFLSELRRKNVPVQIITNHRERSVLSKAGASQYIHAGKADALYTLCMDSPRPAGWFSTIHPAML